MEVQLDADHTNQLFDKTSKLLTEAILRFKEDGLELTASDPATVCMINLEVPEESFNSYEVEPEDEEYENLREEGEEGLLIGVNLENLSTIAKLFDEQITFTVDENQLVLTEEDDRFEIPILNLSTDDIPDVDVLEHDVKADLETAEFKTLIDKLAVAGETATLTLNEEGNLDVEGGGDQISVETSFQLDNPEILVEDEEEMEIRSMFALEYLDKARKVFGKLDTCDTLEVKLGEDFPVEMVHESERENLNFILAPRIEEQ